MTDESPTAAIIPFARRTYCAKLTNALVDGLDIRVAGTLDGYIDFSIETSDGENRTYSLSCDGARAVVTALNTTLHDINANCLFERDAFLVTT